jgi:hypothetical protein
MDQHHDFVTGGFTAYIGSFLICFSSGAKRVYNTQRGTPAFFYLSFPSDVYPLFFVFVIFQLSEGVLEGKKMGLVRRRESVMVRPIYDF